jgi:uroporphyrinogen decarboxylase
MTSKERVAIALNHEEPDLVPLYVFKGIELMREMSRELNVAFDANQISLAMGEDMLIAYGGIVVDMFRYVGAPSDDECPEQFVSEDWGITLGRVSYPGGRYYEVVGHPLADERAFDTWHPPDPCDPGRYQYLQYLLDTYGKTHWIVGGLAFTTLFETAWYLRGHAAFLEDMLVNKDFAHALLDRLLAWDIEVAKRQAALGCDMILFGDDYGMQDRLIMSLPTWREFLKPRYARLFEEMRGVNRNVKTALHSDGNVMDIVPDLIEVGLDVLQPIQPHAMDLAELKWKYGRHLALWGGVDVQRVLPLGTPRDVEQEVRERIRTLAPGGGYILCTSHNIQPDVPPANVKALYEAAGKYRRYPVVV